MEKHWKKRSEVSIGELEDLWEANNKLEIARSLILGLRDMQMPLKEKTEFLHKVLNEDSSSVTIEHRAPYIYRPALEVFLTLVPEWKEEFSTCGNRILGLMGSMYHDCFTQGLSGKVKRFVHSYLNTHKKDDIGEGLIARVLIYNGMFEELINYNFTSTYTVEILWNFLFAENNAFPDNHYRRGSFFGRHDRLSQKYRKEFLLSLDKVENRHALSALYTLLAKRGDLQRIFEIE